MTKREILNKTLEAKGSFRGAVEELINLGWNRSDFEKAGLQEAFSNHELEEGESWQEIDNMIKDSTGRVPSHPSQTMKMLCKKHGVTHVWNRHKTSKSKDDTLFFYSAKFKGARDRVEAADFDFMKIMGDQLTSDNGYWKWCETEDPSVHGVVKND